MNTKSETIKSVSTLLLAVLFLVFFQFTKQYPPVRDINVFNQDPYDAIGSFGTILTVASALVSGLFFQRTHLRRLVVLASLATLCADTVALIRFRNEWVAHD